MTLQKVLKKSNMNSDPILIAGLGNPGPEYRGTWHNLGFRVVEKLAAELKIDFLPGKGEYLYAFRKIAGREVYLMKPTSYMNLSGRPILDFVELKDLFHENTFVICDDINLPLNRIRIRGKGSDGGHNGLESVIYHLGTENFPRLRLGISTGDEIVSLKKYVLSEINDKISETVDEMLNRAVEAVNCYIHQGLEKSMSLYNQVVEESIKE